MSKDPPAFIGDAFPALGTVDRDGAKAYVGMAALPLTLAARDPALLRTVVDAAVTTLSDDVPLAGHFPGLRVFARPALPLRRLPVGVHNMLRRAGLDTCQRLGATTPRRLAAIPRAGPNTQDAVLRLAAEASWEALVYDPVVQREQGRPQAALAQIQQITATPWPVLLSRTVHRVWARVSRIDQEVFVRWAMTGTGTTAARLAAELGVSASAMSARTRRVAEILDGWLDEDRTATALPAAQFLRGQLAPTLPAAAAERRVCHLMPTFDARLTWPLLACLGYRRAPRHADPGLLVAARV